MICHQRLMYTRISIFGSELMIEDFIEVHSIVLMLVYKTFFRATDSKLVKMCFKLCGNSTPKEVYNNCRFI